MKSPIFIVGLPRSGSTLWLNIFAKRPEVLRLGEMLYLTPWRKDFRHFLRHEIGDLGEGGKPRLLAQTIAQAMRRPGLEASFWYNDLASFRDDPIFAEQLEQRISDAPRTLGGIFVGVLDQVREASPAERICVKFPVYPTFAHKLFEWYPDCRVVHIIRDPRATVVSRKNDPGGTRLKLQRFPRLAPVIKLVMSVWVIFQYTWTSRVHARLRENPNYKLFRFEDLLNNPEEVIRGLCRFAEVEFTPAMLNPRPGQASSVTGKAYGGFKRSAATHWRQRISGFEEWAIRKVSRTAMKRFGFSGDAHPVYCEDPTIPGAKEGEELARGASGV